MVGKVLIVINFSSKQSSIVCTYINICTHTVWEDNIIEWAASPEMMNEWMNGRMNETSNSNVRFQELSCCIILKPPRELIVYYQVWLGTIFLLCCCNRRTEWTRHSCYGFAPLRSFHLQMEMNTEGRSGKLNQSSIDSATSKEPKCTFDFFFPGATCPPKVA